MIGRVIASRYRIEKKLGAGAMGAVYRARHVKVGRAFAIKILHVDLLEDTRLQRRFVREAELAGTLSHPNIVSVIDVGETFEGLHYIAMEYAEGPTLGEIIATQAPIPGPRIIELATQILDGLQHAHKHGLIHRDFKPDNVIIAELDGKESPRIVDFGIAVVRDDASSAQRERLTTAGIVLGTPHYMAPEHVTGQAIDHRIDLFALGVVLYEMLCGKMPYEGDGVDVARANLLEETPHMADRAPNVDVDPLLEAFTRMLLSKAPDARPSTARAARDMLDMIARDRAKAAALFGVAIDEAPLPTRAAKISMTPPSSASAPLARPPRPSPAAAPPTVIRAAAAPVAPGAPPATTPPAAPVAQAAPRPVLPRSTVPRYGSYTPPTPFLAVPEPVVYSPSGQHAYVGTLPEGSPDPTGPLQIADPTGPYVVTTFPESSGPTRARPQSSPSGPYRTRSARVSQAPLPRDASGPIPTSAESQPGSGAPSQSGGPCPASQPASNLPRPASQPGVPTAPRAPSQPGVAAHPRPPSMPGVPYTSYDSQPHQTPPLIDPQSSQSLGSRPFGSPPGMQPFGSQPGSQPFDSQHGSQPHAASHAGAPATTRRARTESVKRAALVKRRMYIMISVALAALALGALLAILLR
jgi:serine/threonine-protein kinase